MDLFNENNVYCQTCGRVISDGGYVSDAKKVYHHNQKCVPKNSEDNTLEVRTKGEIQRDIRSGDLLYYGQLEKTVSK